MNGANLIIECLKAHYVNTICDYPGGAIMPTYDAIYDSGLDHLLCRNKQGAAIGYARASGKVGVCIATSGTGATNLVTGLGDALMDSIPIVAYSIYPSPVPNIASLCKTSTNYRKLLLKPLKSRKVADQGRYCSMCRKTSNLHRLRQNLSLIHCKK